MKKLLSLIVFFVSPWVLANGETSYQVSFDNAVHHEAEISVTFTNIQTPVLEVQMSRSSPGRYAMHEFAKNVYRVSAVNSQGGRIGHIWWLNCMHGTSPNRSRKSFPRM